MNCPTSNIVEIPLVVDECNGEIKSTNCVVHPTELAFLDLPAFSKQTDINNALSVSAQSALARVDEMEALLEDVVVPDGSETKVVAGNNIDISGIGTESDPYIVSTNMTTIGSYIVENKGYTFIGNSLTIASDWEWKINNVDSTNTAPIVINVPLASVGNSRIDLIVLTYAGLIYRVPGIQTTGTATAPVAPEDTIVALFTYSDSTTTDVVVPTPIYPISQQIRSGETTYAPSEDTIYQALYIKAYDADVVHLEGNEVLRNGKKTFVNTSSDNAIEVDNQGVGSGIAIDNTSTGKAIKVINSNSGDMIHLESETSATGLAIKISKNSVTTGTVNDNAEYTGNKFIKSGATTNDFLKGNGDIDNTPYEDSANKQDSLATDGTGIKYPTVDAVNGSLNNIYSILNPNTYVVLDNGFTQASQDITINAGWQWKIDGNDNSNGAPIVINVPLAVSTFNRIDIIVLDNLNNAELISGIETTGTPVTPTVPIGTIDILFLYVDSIIPILTTPRPRYTVSQYLRDGVIDYSPSENIVFDALALKAETTYVDAKVVQTITNGDTTHSPSGDAIFDNLALKANTTYVDAKITQTITNGATTTAPSEDVVFDALVLKADITYVDSLLVGVLNDRGNYDASTNLFPSTGGSGGAGAILKGDLWFISVPGTLNGVPVAVGDSVRALVNTPGQTGANWNVLDNNLGYVPENSINKSTTTSDSASSIKFPVWSAIVSYFDLSRIKSILGITVLSGDNTGDNATNTQYSGLAASKEDTANKSNSQGDIASTTKFPTWAAVVTYVVGLFSNLKTVGGTSLIGAGDVAFKTVNSTAVTGSGNISTIFPSRETGTTSPISNADNGGVVIITSSCTITIPSGLVAGFECSFVTLSGATLTIALGGGVTLENNASLIMLPQYSFTLKNRTAANAYVSTGYL
jgi:hypothetical protein